MSRKLGSFRKSFADKREREKLLSSMTGDYYTELPGFRRSDEYPEKGSGLLCCSSLSDKVSGLWKTVKSVSLEAWEVGRSDPRKIVFSAKMGLALMLISLLIFFKEPIEELSRYCVWAILTVVVVFEFSIGATLSKGFNRGLGTLSAGGIALGTAELCELAGDWEELVIVTSVFITGFIITYAKLYPKMKPYEYGFRVFLITYCFIMVSGYRTRDFIHTAVTRFLLIALGAGVSLAVNVCVYPIWAGEDLHNLVAKNFISVATSLEGCISGYLSCVAYKKIPSKILTYEASDDPVYSGYRSAVESMSQEDALIGFAIWEPPHGPYKMFKYPWRDYVKVSGALRHCAFMVMALHGCILSEIQAPPEKRHVFSTELERVGMAGAKVLHELGNKVKRMEKLGTADLLYEVHEAVESLQKKVDRKSYILVNSETWEIGSRTKEFKDPQDFAHLDDDESTIREHKSLSEATLDFRSFPLSRSCDSREFHMDPKSIYAQQPPRLLPRANVVPEDKEGEEKEDKEEEESKTYESARSLSLATFTSLLIEFVARLQNVVDSFEELSEKANFKEPVDSQESEEVTGVLTRIIRYLKFWKRSEHELV